MCRGRCRGIAGGVPALIRALALRDALAPRRNRLLGDHRVVEAAVAACDEAAKSDGLDLAPALAGAGEVRQYAIVIGQRRRRHLLPRLAPQRDRGLELVTRRKREQVGVDE